MRSKLAAAVAMALASVSAIAAAPAWTQPADPSIRATPERPFLLLDQVRSGPVPDALTPQIKALNTLEDIEALLTSEGISFERRKGSLDSRALGPQLAAVIAALPPGEVFVIPGQGVVTFNQVLRALTPAEAAAPQGQSAPTPP